MGIATYLLLRIPSYYFRDLMPIACFAAAPLSEAIILANLLHRALRG